MSNDPTVLSRRLPWGFIFGPATVERHYADRLGVGLEVSSARESVGITVSPSGVIKVSRRRKCASKWRGTRKEQRPLNTLKAGIANLEQYKARTIGFCRDNDCELRES